MLYFMTNLSFFLKLLFKIGSFKRSIENDDIVN